MRVLVACEESQAVCTAFRDLGHEAYSADIQECSGGHPEWHICGDVLPYINGNCQFTTMDGETHHIDGKWDILIAFPPCTYISNAGACRLYPKKGQLDMERYAKGLEAKEFFLKFLNADCPRIAIENPVSSKVYQMPKHSQEIQPYMFGHPYTKKTRLWLRGGLPPLEATNLVEPISPYVPAGTGRKDRSKYGSALRKGGDSKNRSKTFPGIAKAMADQWGNLPIESQKGGEKLRLIVYDAEVFKYDWIMGFKDLETGTYTEIHNDNEALKECISDDCVYIGFNSKHYDQFIMKAIACGFTPEEVKKLNDYLIGGGRGWEYEPLKDFFFVFNNVDIKDDMQMGLSLKAIEGHLGMDIEETEVDFNLDRPLTEEELAMTIHYNKHDLDATEQVVKLRKTYLENKIHIGALAGLTAVKAMSMTNAKLTAAMLKATRKSHDDERKYVYPEKLLRQYIPDEVFEFFDRMYDPEIPDDDLFKGKFEFTIGDCPVTLGFGGIHGAVPHYMWNEGNGKRIIRNYDVASYYPHLMTLCGYTSRNIPSAATFEEVLETRMKAKAAGDKKTANALKLVVNTTYGAMLNQYNDLCDPLMGRSVCITGQLFLLELSEHCFAEIPDLRIVQLNTDGMMIEFDEEYYDKVLALTQEWQDRTGFELEEDKIVSISQKDVNNYVEVQEGGKAKSKGGYLVRGIAPAGAFNINNNACIVATALQEYFVHGTPVEETINGCDDLSKFQIIAKAGAKYREAYHLVDGEQVPVQKVNRVYATADERYGKIFKVKAENDSTAKIEMLPEHCIIDNNNHLTIADVDKSFYIAMAHKRINDFMGVKPEKKARRTKKMATTKATADKQLNVYQKLIKARADFLKGDVQKTGKNMHLSFKYFELDDIVPTATRIFEEIGLVGVVGFTADTASMNIINTDNPEEMVSFTAPFNQIQPIVSNAGKQATNEMQALGSSITYMRRYLYMMALDICESDSIDANIGKDSSTSVPTPAVAAPKKAPATPEQRQEVKEELTAPEDNATALQIKGLKAVLKKLKTAHPDKEEFIAKIAVDTKGFTVITKSDCETLINKISALLDKEG